MYRDGGTGVHVVKVPFIIYGSTHAINVFLWAHIAISSDGVNTLVDCKHKGWGCVISAHIKVQISTHCLAQEFPSSVLCDRFQSERESGDRNFAIGYYLKEKKVWIKLNWLCLSLSFCCLLIFICPRNQKGISQHVYCLYLTLFYYSLFWKLLFNCQI